MFQNPKILDLPREMLAAIVNKLPYSDVQSVRLTCSVFNNVGLFVQKTRHKKCQLHEMKRLAESATDNLYTLMGVYESDVPVQIRRAFASVHCLLDITRVADASTYYFALDGSLPPVPCGLLTDFEKALSLATKSSPFVDNDCLKSIITGFDEYLTMAMNGLQSPLEMTSVFRSTTDLIYWLNNFSFVQFNHTAYGLRCHTSLEHFSPSLILSRNENDLVLTAPLLIRFLARLNFKVIATWFVEKIYKIQEINIEEEFQIRMGNLFTDQTQTVDAEISRVELNIHCRPEQTVGVHSEEQIVELEPTDFEVRFLAGTTVRRPRQRSPSNRGLHLWQHPHDDEDDDDDDWQLTTYKFASSTNLPS